MENEKTLWDCSGNWFQFFRQNDINYDYIYGVNIDNKLATKYYWMMDIKERHHFKPIECFCLSKYSYITTSISDESIPLVVGI